MRVTSRSHGGNRSYWQRRWEQIPPDEGSLNLDRYPGRYAEAVMAETVGPVLEAGCGAGRVLIHYHHRGRWIAGMDFITTALQKIRQVEPGMPMLAADASSLPFVDRCFAAVLAFGLYHNLEHGIDAALAETRRVLKTGGLLCASMRADNLQNRIIDWLANRDSATSEQMFHKANYSYGELQAIFKKAGFDIVRVEYVENMPFLYKLAAFRHRTHRVFDERKARAEGYRLSSLGAAVQRLLVRFWPASFCNIFVITCR